MNILYLCNINLYIIYKYIGYFSCCCNKIPEKTNLRKKELMLAQGWTEQATKACWQKREAAHLIASTVNNECWRPPWILPFLQSRIPAHIYGQVFSPQSWKAHALLWLYWYWKSLPFCVLSKSRRLACAPPERWAPTFLLFLLPNIPHTAAVLNLWVTNPLRVKGLFHRGHLRPAENTDICYNLFP